MQATERQIRTATYLSEISLAENFLIHYGGRMHRSAARLGGASGLVVVLALASACTGGSSGSAPPTQETAGGQIISSGPSGSPGSSVASRPTSASPREQAGARAKAEITKAYTEFFSSTSPESASVLQHGRAFTKVLAQQAKAPPVPDLSATVSKIVQQSPDVAAVTFSVLSKGSPLLADTPGYAVRENGTWKVAAATFCALLQLQNSAPAACSDTSITALPR
jgi:hypothetical protein